MARPRRPKARPSPIKPVTYLWLEEQFKEVDLANAANLAGIDDLKKQNVLILANQKKLADELAGNLPVIPELEAAIDSNRALALRIDRKVPDNPNTKG
jgi:hypothetical protein